MVSMYDPNITIIPIMQRGDYNMSNSGLAILNSRTLYESGDMRGARFWADKAVGVLPNDLIMTDHIIPSTEGNLPILRCSRCHTHRFIPTMASAAHFRDRHFYCGEAEVDCGICGTCKRRHFPWETECRFCRAALTMDDPQPCTPSMVLKQWATYQARVGDYILAELKCGSRLKAEAAAERMLPEEGVTVRFVK